MAHVLPLLLAGHGTYTNHLCSAVPANVARIFARETDARARRGALAEMTNDCSCVCMGICIKNILPRKCAVPHILYELLRARAREAKYKYIVHIIFTITFPRARKMSIALSLFLYLVHFSNHIYQNQIHILCFNLFPFISLCRRPPVRI